MHLSPAPVSAPLIRAHVRTRLNVYCCFWALVKAMQKPAALQKVHLAATMDANAFVKAIHYWKGSLSNPVESLFFN